MDVKKIHKESFCVIGKLGSTADGEGFVARLWAEANAHFQEVAPLAKLDEGVVPIAFWGAMSDMQMRFEPWEDNFSKGLYLAGVEAKDDAVAPEGWTKWTIPGYEYLHVKVEGGTTFLEMLAHLEKHGLQLVGAVQDHIVPKESGQAYMCFPVRRLFGGAK